MRSCDNRVDHVPRGKMLGGCHSHNASAWVRGHPSDFDHWAYLGNAGWDWSNAARLFEKIDVCAARAFIVGWPSQGLGMLPLPNSAPIR